jgi:hypothetical protein
MALVIDTFTALRPGSPVRPGGNAGGMSLFKALGHPLAAPLAKALVQRLRDGSFCNCSASTSKKKNTKPSRSVKNN